MRVPQSVAVFTLLVSMKATLSISARGRPHRPATSFVRSAKNLCIYASASSREYEMNNGGGICRSPIAASPSPTVKFDCYEVLVMPIQNPPSRSFVVSPSLRALVVVLQPQFETYL